MTARFTLGIQLFLVFPPEGKPLIGLALTAQLPDLQPAGVGECKAASFSDWFASLGLYGAPKGFPTFASLPSSPALLALPAPEPLEPDNGAFLQFVDKGYEALDDQFCAVVKLANEGVLVPGCGPDLCEQGEGGTYFLRDADGARIAVFKPADEDPQADNNPKKKTAGDKSPRVSRKTIPKGEAALREVAAFEFDRGYAGVPATRMMKARTSYFNGSDSNAAQKVGSLQLFVDSEGESWDVAPYKFSTQDVHRVGIFDIRSLNTDRHGGNILVVSRDEPKHGGCLYDLVPIDHGFCFPTALSEANWEWLYWPQAKKPFDAETLRYIASIDLDEDSALLRRLGLSEEAVRVNKITTTLLKRGAAAGLNLFEIAKLCLRKRFRDQEEPSPLEKVCEASEIAAAGNLSAFWCLLDDAVCKLVDKRA